MANLKSLSIAILVAITLTACQEKPDLKEIEAKLEQKKSTENKSVLTNDTLKAIDKTLSGVNKSVDAKDVKFSITPFIYELPKAMQDACNINSKPNDTTNQKTTESLSDNMLDETDFCTKIEIELAKMEPIWVEQVVNKTITNDDNPKLLKFKQSVDDFVDEHLVFINDSKALAKENGEEFTGTMAYVWSEKPELLPAFNNVAQVVIYSDMFMGGAHGIQNARYLIFDMDLQSQIKLHDVVKKNKEGEFFELAHKAFKHYLKTELELKNEREIKEYEETWAFTLPESFYFSDTGLKLIYQPYEIGAYAQGFIELTLPYDERLLDMIKQQYLPAGQTSINP